MVEKMKCALCGKTIEKYDIKFHHLIIDEKHSADICPDCLDKITKWQSKINASLFPTKTMKKIYNKEK